MAPERDIMLDFYKKNCLGPFFSELTLIQCLSHLWDIDSTKWIDWIQNCVFELHYSYLISVISNSIPKSHIFLLSPQNPKLANRGPINPITVLSLIVAASLIKAAPMV